MLSSSVAEPSEPAKTPAETVEAFLKALESFDLGAALDLCSPNIRYRNAPLPATKDKRQFEWQLRLMTNNLARFEVQMRSIEARDPQTVFTDRIDILEGRGFFSNLPVQGTFRVEDGLITEWTDQPDWPALGADCVKSLPSIVGHFARRFRP